MAWTIEESRVSPFLTAAERRDVTWTLWRLQTRRCALHETEATSQTAKRFGKDTKDGKDFKDGKEGKDYKDAKDAKDGKDGKDYKDGKEGKDYKDGKEFKDYKDGKEGKDFKDAKDYKDYERSAELPNSLPRMVRAVTGIAPASDQPGDILAILRASRATRFLRERGLVI
jgi:hypothetical protein